MADRLDPSNPAHIYPMGHDRAGELTPLGSELLAMDEAQQRLNRELATGADLLARMKEEANAAAKALSNLESGSTAKQWTKLYEKATEAQKKFFMEERRQTKEVHDRWVNAGVGLASTFGKAMNTVARNISSNFGLSAQEAFGEFSKLAFLLPGVFGAAASAISGTLQAVLAKLNFEAEKLRLVARGVMLEFAGGKVNAQQSVAQVGLRTQVDFMERALETFREQMTQAESFSRFTNIPGVRQAFLAGNVPGATGPLEAEYRRSLELARVQEQIFRVMNRTPAIQAINQGLSVDRARAAIATSINETEAQIRAQESRGFALDLGLGPEHAELTRIQSERIAVVAGQIRREGESFRDAWERARTAIGDSLDPLHQVQLNELRARVSADLLLHSYRDRQAILVQTAQNDVVRRQITSTEILADRDSERIEAQRLLNEQLITQLQYQERIAQIVSNEASDRRATQTQQVSSTVERNMRPLETFQREVGRINNLTAEFLNRPGGEEQQQRAFGGAGQNLINAAGDMYRHSRLLREGSVEAYQAIQQAQIQEIKNDPVVQLNNATINLTAQNVELTRWTRELAQATLNQVRPELSPQAVQDIAVQQVFRLFGFFR